MFKRDAFVLICRSSRTAEKAVRTLQAAHFDIHKISILGKDCIGFTGDTEASTSDKERKSLVETMSFWYRMWHLLTGDAFLNVEGIGAIVVVGPMAKLMCAAWANPKSFNACSPLRKELRAIGVPQEKMTRYETALKQNCFLVITHGSSVEVMAARNIFKCCAEGNRMKAGHAGFDEDMPARYNPKDVSHKAQDRISRDVDPGQKGIPSRAEVQS